MRRLSLGLILIVLTSGVLLVSDWGQRKTGPNKVPRVAILQHASQKILDDAIEGMKDGLAENGFVEPQSISIQRFNAENDVATANAIAKEITNGHFDLILTASTLSL